VLRLLGSSDLGPGGPHTLDRPAVAVYGVGIAGLVWLFLMLALRPRKRADEGWMVLAAAALLRDGR